MELAQLKYRAARLVGLRDSLSRLGGGIGTRGPGEKKLETDRRLIRTRISALKEELRQVEKHRELIRGSRARRKDEDRGYRGVHQRGEIHSSECPYRGGSAGGGQAFRHAGSNHEGFWSFRTGRASSYRYGRIYPETAPSSCGGV